MSQTTNAVDGKEYDATNVSINDGNRTGKDQLYWGLEGANKNWWMSDLKTKQASYTVLSSTDTAIVATTL